MLLTYDKTNQQWLLAVSVLAGFVRRFPDRSPKGFLPVAEAWNEITLTHRTAEMPCNLADGHEIRLTAEAECGMTDEGNFLCSFSREVRRNPENITPSYDMNFLATAFITAYLLTQTEGKEEICIRLCYLSAENYAIWRGNFPKAYLQRIYTALFERAEPFLLIELSRQDTGRTALKACKFPYPKIREGQKELMEWLYSCIRKKERMLISAPTGIGKTISVLFPSLRAVGTRLADRIFYFSAKTVTGTAAMDAFRLLSRNIPQIHAIRLNAKERLCPRTGEGKPLRTLCRDCPLCGFADGKSYEERRDTAMLALLAGSVIDRREILRAAADANICPYELSLDTSEYCELIVCDYGYLIDPAVRLQRYFVKKRDEKYIFLLDEAHNLPDRAREIHSARLNADTFFTLIQNAVNAFPRDTALCESVTEMYNGLAQIRSLCLADCEEKGGKKAGYYVAKDMPAFFSEAVAGLRAVCDARLKVNYEAYAPTLEEIRQTLRQFATVAAEAKEDEAYTFYAETDEGKVDCRFLCLNPAKPLDEIFSLARTTVLFSATLSPMEYHAEICGCPDARFLELESPYERENLCLVTVDSVSTRLSERKQTAEDITEWISVVTESRKGNYIVYFPSYQYMEIVRRRFVKQNPYAHIIVQKSGMTLKERDRFLKEFSDCAERGESVIAFCVLGGIFSEGIDLSGEKLIGTVIVGIGLPGLSSELNLLQEYYDKTCEQGRAYAYVYPAMNRILQAAGRVIRNENDRGVVVLIDDRYKTPEMHDLFPAHWNRMQYADDPYQLADILETFWNGK